MASDNEHNLALDQPLTSIYPNPAKGKVTVIVTLEKNEQAVIMLYDIQGRLVETIGTISSATGGTERITCNLDNKKPGVYNVVITSNKALKSTYKLVIE
jgi:pectate lyase